MKKFVTAFMGLVLWVCLFLPCAQAESGSQQLEEKLDRVLRNQEKILAKLEELKSELQVVKVRASQRG